MFLPSGNTFGITAASAENPDSFEIFKFALSVPDAAAPGSQSYQHRPYESQHVPNNNKQNSNPNQQQAPNVDNSVIDNRLNDMQNRLQVLMGITERLLTEMQSLSSKVDERHQDALKKLAPNRDQAGQIEQRMQRIENMLQAVQKDVKNSDLKKQFNKLQDSLKSSHSGVIEHLQSTSHRTYMSFSILEFFQSRFRPILLESAKRKPKTNHIKPLLAEILSSTPRMGFFIFLIVAFQLSLAASYIIYKRRRSSMPKKFL